MSFVGEISVLPAQDWVICVVSWLYKDQKIHKVSLTQYSLGKRDAQIRNNVICVGLLSEKQCVRSVSSSCTKRRRSTAFHTHGPGDGCAPQLLHTRCLIVPFAYLAALFHFPCCWCWENTHNNTAVRQLPALSFPLLSASPCLFLLPLLWLSGLSFAFDLIKAWFEKKNCKVIHRAVTMSMGTLFFFSRAHLVFD